MERVKQEQKQNLSIILSIVVWFVLMLSHSFVIGAESKDIPYFWQDVSKYLSIWILDLLVIGTWYLNFHLLAPKLIRQRQFVAYVIIVLLFMVLGLFLPLVLYHILGWEMPIEGGGARVSLYGCMVMLLVFAVGLSVRSLITWIRLQMEVNDLKLKNRTLESELVHLRQYDHNSSTRIEADSTEGQSSEKTKDPEIFIQGPVRTDLSDVAIKIREEDEEEPLHT